MYIEKTAWAKSLGWRADVEGRQNVPLGWALVGKNSSESRNIVGTSKKTSLYYQKKEWAPFWAYFLLSAGWGSHNTPLTFSLLFPGCFFFFSSVTAKKIINIFLKHSEKLRLEHCLWHRPQDKLIVKITTSTGLGREKGILAHQWVWLYYHTLKNMSAGNVGIFCIPLPFAVTFHDLSKLCAKVTALVHLGQVVSGVSFDSRYFYSPLNFGVCLNCKTLALV